MVDDLVEDNVPPLAEDFDPDLTDIEVAEVIDEDDAEPLDFDPNAWEGLERRLAQSYIALERERAKAPPDENAIARAFVRLQRRQAQYGYWRTRRLILKLQRRRARNRGR